MIEELDKRIDKKFDALESQLEYQLESLCAVVSGLESIRYLLFIKEKMEQKENKNKNL